MQLVPRVEQSRGVEHDHLDVTDSSDAYDAVACRLRLLADDGQLLTDDSVEQGRLARVRLSDDGHDSGTRHGRHSKADRTEGRQSILQSVELTRDERDCWRACR